MLFQDGTKTQLSMDLHSETLQFLDRIMLAIQKQSWTKCTISKPGNEQEWNVINVRPVYVKGQPMIQVVTRFPTKDVTKNLTSEEWLLQLKTWIQEKAFKEINFFSSCEHLVWKVSKKGKVSLRVTELEAQQTPAEMHHNREKNYLIPADAGFLHLLGLSSAEGKILADGQRKFRQVNKYIEVLSRLISQGSNNTPLRIMDMGSGSGYLTFALYDFLQNSRQIKVEMTGVELRPALVEKCNTIAKRLGFDGLNFWAGDINHLEAAKMDILIALHACDIATDMAIAAGIKAGAQLIILAPCCQKQVRKSMEVPTQLKPLLKHGILLERQAELLTDSIRSLYLEAYGYRSRVFEFVSMEHTSKNIMITAERTKPRPEAISEIENIKSLFGIKEHYLEHLLK